MSVLATCNADFTCVCGAWHNPSQGVAYSFECRYCIEDAMVLLWREVWR